MTVVSFLSPQGQPVAEVALAPGQSVMQAALQAGVAGIEAECGGCLTCATCHVYVQAGSESLPPADPEEAAMLAFVAAERRPGSRLACQLHGADALPAMTVQVPERQY